MTLRDIIEEVMDIEEGLMYGTISFKYDKLMSAMKPGHPMIILDNIIAQIFWDVRVGREPELDKVKDVISDMKDFKKCFEVDELERVIKHLEEYVASVEEKDE